jgi:hypothetical protein
MSVSTSSSPLVCHDRILRLNLRGHYTKSSAQLAGIS